jgi:bla regulator protein BlaR1
VIAQAAGPDATALLAAANRWLAAAAHPVANHLWQSTVFAAIAAALALALRKNQARARYWIWMSASVKMLLPFALLASAASHWVKPRAIAAPA